MTSTPMSWPDSALFQLSTRVLRRRSLLGAAGATGALSLGAAMTPASAATPPPAPVATTKPTLTAGAVTVTFDGQVRVMRSGRLVSTMAGVYFSDTARATAGTAKIVGSQLVVTYAAPAGFGPVVGTYSILGDAVNAVYTYTAPTGHWADGTMVLRTIAGQGSHQGIPVNDWVKDAKGGLPMYVHTFSAHKQVTTANGAIWECVDRNNSQWVNDGAFHAPAVAKGSNAYQVTYSLVTTDPGLDRLPMARRPRPVLTTDMPFNWITTPGTMVVHADLSNVTGAGTLTWSVRSFTGAVIASGKQATAGAQRINLSAKLPAVGSYFVVADWSNTAGTKATARTMLAVTANLTSSDDRLGVSALRPQSGGARGVQRKHWFTLMAGMGIGRLRQPDDITPVEGTAARLVCNQNVPVASVSSTAGQRELFAKWVADAKAFNSPWIELGNELNTMKTEDQTGAAEYTRNWIIPFKEYLVETGSPAKLLVSGLAGPNIGWLKGIAAAGGWTSIDGIALHPARGNCTADFVPGIDPKIQGGDYWNFLGAVRAVKVQRDALDKQYGRKTAFLLTEAYACTYPNSWWEDTVRHAAENVLLSTALAKAEGVDAMYWYEPHDGIQDDLDAAMRLDMPDTQAREYHFGLLNGDHSLKPSMLALATASAHLKDANFVRSISKGTLRALEFRTPRGPLHVVWDRTDGYQLNKNHATQMYTDSQGRQRWNQPEWWVDQWQTKVTTPLAATGTSVRVISCIGATSTVAAVGGKATLTLDGAPVLVYGLGAI